MTLLRLYLSTCLNLPTVVCRVGGPSTIHTNSTGHRGLPGKDESRDPFSQFLIQHLSLNRIFTGVTGPWDCSRVEGHQTWPPTAAARRAFKTLKVLFSCARMAQTGLQMLNRFRGRYEQLIPGRWDFCCAEQISRTKTFDGCGTATYHRYAMGICCISIFYAGAMKSCIEYGTNPPKQA